jgi:hypothetical protein
VSQKRQYFGKKLAKQNNNKIDPRKLDETGVFKKPVDPSKKSKSRDGGETSGEKRKMSALEEIMKEEEERKKKQVPISRS